MADSLKPDATDEEVLAHAQAWFDACTGALGHHALVGFQMGDGAVFVRFNESGTAPVRVEGRGAKVEQPKWPMA